MRPCANATPRGAEDCNAHVVVVVVVVGSILGESTSNNGYFALDFLVRRFRPFVPEGK